MNAEEFQRFTAGEALAVDPDAVERELASLWQTAGQGTEGTAPVTRACLVNVLAVTEERPGLEGYGHAERLQQAIDDLPRFVAARSLLVRNQPDQDGQAQLESWISANCILAEGGGKLVCSEEVTIAARGGADHHVPGVVRALLVPGLPTNALFAGIPYGALAEPLLLLADRVVSDVDASSHRSPLPPLARVVYDGRHSGMDLGWVTTAALRAELAGAFDPPFDAEELLTVTELHCITPPSVQWSSRLVLGWLARSIGSSAATAKHDPAVEAADRPGSFRLERTNGTTLTLRITVDPDAAGPGYVFVAPTWREPVSVRCTTGAIEVNGPFFSAVRRPRSELSGAAALARALINRSEDAAFLGALRTAELLA